jgi:thiol:disulfide interchange protein
MQAQANTETDQFFFAQLQSLLRSFLLLACLLALLPLAAATTAAQGPGLTSSGPAALGSAATQPEFLPVEQAYPLAVEQVAAEKLRLIWQMPAGYYLYQHAFRFAVTHADETVDVEVEFPPALEREDEYFGLVQVYYDSAELELTADAPLAGTQLSVTSQGCADAGLCYPPRTQRFEISQDGSITEITASPIRARASTPGGTASNTAAGAASAGLSTLLFMMLLSFAGGMILNLMPCVLPILSLKVIGFASAPTAERHRHGLFYSLGVIGSFLVVAGVLLACAAPDRPSAGASSCSHRPSSSHWPTCS